MRASVGKLAGATLPQAAACCSRSSAVGNVRMYPLRMQGLEVERRRRANPFPDGYAQPPLELAR